MARNVRYFETVEEFNAVYGNSESGYTEPWVAYIEETEGVAYSKPVLTAITLSNVRMLADVPASGGTVTVDDLTYEVTAKYDNFKEEDVTSEATVTGVSLNVASSWTEERHSAGTMSLTAEYGGLSASSQITVYQEAFVPTLTGITIDDLEWVANIPMTGGTATSANCSFVINAHYDNETEKNITTLASVTGYLEVSSSSTAEEHSAGTLTLTATYEEFSASSNVTVYQDGASPYLIEPLTFNIISGGAIAYWIMVNGSFSSQYAKTIEYKVNDGNWISFTPTENETYVLIPVNSGDKLSFRGDNDAYSDNNNFYNCFGGDQGALYSIEGNIMSLVNSTGFTNEDTLTEDYAFTRMFMENTGLTSVEHLVLPATALTEYCYSQMFQNCTSLTIAPELPATTLANGCYCDMFYSCTSLTTTPTTLPATALAEGCYDEMFSQCTSLTTAPELPSTALTEGCYCYMFEGCTSLTSAPELPATALTDGCYNSMFYGCTSLTTAPELPATTLVEGCYNWMFGDCTSLNYIKCLATNISASNCTTNWVNGVAATGTFVKHPNMSSWTTGVNGIPNNWIVQDAS